MSWARSIKRQGRAAIPAAIFLSLVGYFAWNATRGELGLHAYVRRLGDLQSAQAVLATAGQERDDWQRRVAALEPGQLDRDALDEQARRIMSLSAANDLVVPQKN